jgi:hypothetical protein
LDRRGEDLHDLVLGIDIFGGGLNPKSFIKILGLSFEMLTQFAQQPGLRQGEIYAQRLAEFENKHIFLVDLTRLSSTGGVLKLASPKGGGLSVMNYTTPNLFAKS